MLCVKYFFSELAVQCYMLSEKFLKYAKDTVLMCYNSFQKMTVTPATTTVAVTNAPSSCSVASSAAPQPAPAREASCLHVAWRNSPITSGVPRQRRSRPACKATDTRQKQSTKEYLVKTKVRFCTDFFNWSFFSFFRWKNKWAIHLN